MHSIRFCGVAAAIAAAALVLAPTAASASLPLPPEFAPICDRAKDAAAAACTVSPCQCEIGSAVGSDLPALKSAYTLRIFNAAIPTARYDVTHLVIESDGRLLDYGPLFGNGFEHAPEGKVEARGAIKRFWMEYSVERYGTVLVADFDHETVGESVDNNFRSALRHGTTVIAFVHEGALRVLEIGRTHEEEIRRLDKKRKLEPMFGPERKAGWKRTVTLQNTGRLRITKATGNHPKLKQPHQLVASPLLEVLHAFDDEVTVRTSVD